MSTVNSACPVAKPKTASRRSHFGLLSTPFTRDERPLEGAQGIVPRYPVENLRQAVARSRRRDGADSSTGRRECRCRSVKPGIAPVSASNRANVNRETRPILKVPLAAGSPPTWSIRTVAPLERLC